ncbi:hypothetical protein MPER_04094 [Moniliophthora perniciosa FA553]|nr:hypothetical protein MPER_04094 [Moniliophthora perniciosa FA553]
MASSGGVGGGPHEDDTEPEDDEDECRFWGPSSPTSTAVTSPVKSTFSFATSVAEKEVNTSGTAMVKTTAQKTAHLSTMLGNVDALVEGVRRAGIWGVG